MDSVAEDMFPKEGYPMLAAEAAATDAERQRMMMKHAKVKQPDPSPTFHAAADRAADAVSAAADSASSVKQATGEKLGAMYADYLHHKKEAAAHSLFDEAKEKTGEALHATGEAISSATSSALRAVGLKHTEGTSQQHHKEQQPVIETTAASTAAERSPTRIEQLREHEEKVFNDFAKSMEKHSAKDSASEAIESAKVAAVDMKEAGTEKVGSVYAKYMHGVKNEEASQHMDLAKERGGDAVEATRDAVAGCTSAVAHTVKHAAEVTAHAVSDATMSVLHAVGIGKEDPVVPPTAIESTATKRAE